MQEEIYISPRKARIKLKEAQKNAQTVYLYGATGYGKTALVRNYLKRMEYLYFNAGNVLVNELAISESIGDRESGRTIVVIDDIQLAEPEDVRSAIVELSGRRDIWLILVGRCRCPSWLLAATLKQYPFMIIEEEELKFDRGMLERYFEQSGIVANEDTLQRVNQVARGHGMAIRIVAELLQDGKTFTEDTIKQVQQIFWDYLDYNVYDQWDTELLEFLMQMSVVDSFTMQMAEHITGKTNVPYLIQKSWETGNFLYEENGVYHYEPAMLESLRRSFQNRYNKQQRDELFYNAGLFYEQEGMVMDALRMYKACGNKNRVGSLLIDNARKNPGSGYLYELRHYYLTLPEETIAESIELTAGMCMLQSILMNTEESERWYDNLVAQEKRRTGSERKAVKSWIAYLDIALPHRGSGGLIDIMKNAFVLLTNRQLTLPEFSVTSNLPSQMNGGKDFCEWSRRDRELAKTIGKPVAVVLGKYGKGFVDIALAESFYEKGGDNYEILSLVSRGRMQAEAGGKLEQCFVAAAIQARVHVINGQIEEAVEILKHFRNVAVKEHGDKLLPNIDTFLFRLALYQGEKAQIEEWMEKAPKEDEEFCTFNRYHYLAKVRGYLLYGRYERAQSLLERLLYYAKVMDRPYIRMESKILLSIALYRMGEVAWKEILLEVLREAEDYHFVRIISREGAAIRELLKSVGWKAEDAEIKEQKAYRRQVLKETEAVAIAYPSYLKVKSMEEEVFSDNAVKILKLQAEGLSNTQIAELLGITESAVKYHCRENYKKLGVRGKAEAVMEARKRKLI
ncbi:LuxR C-terminal-related transcriptional regulator [Roseburia sp. 499]|uniref:LuxR C-terminal-related transcriptional regulator n=1 Tax=Roseburia sp. 499 TaxID=1261634 RepID=UPI000952D779|nr:LuxR C-terminal-related transcriptional regulator [Roseburia sp. 499]WVK71608.1 LuxR C-terminal-related transcriptional regulator [Roseburia sp. 499]